MARILIVDDDQGARFVLGRFVSDRGHYVQFANCGDAALGILADSPFDAVVTDLSMPGLDGLGFIGELRATGNRTPVIAMSGHAPQHLGEARTMGADLTLMKPVSRDQLLDAIDTVVEEPEEVWDLA